MQPKKTCDIQIIIPAAGASSRLGYPKQLVSTDSGPLWQQILKNCLAVNSAKHAITLITGHWRPENQLPEGATECYFPQWASGMGASIAYGVKHSPRPNRGYLIILIDQWGLTTSELNRFISSWDGQSVQIATDAHYSGPPVLLPEHFYQPLSELSGDQGAKSLIKEHNPTRHHVIDARWDLDTLQDLSIFQQVNNAKNNKEAQHGVT